MTQIVSAHCVSFGQAPLEPMDKENSSVKQMGLGYLTWGKYASGVLVARFVSARFVGLAQAPREPNDVEKQSDKQTGLC